MGSPIPNLLAIVETRVKSHLLIANGLDLRVESIELDAEGCTTGSELGDLLIGHGWSHAIRQSAILQSILEVGDLAIEIGDPLVEIAKSGQ